VRVTVAATLFADDRRRSALVELLGCVERGHIVEVLPAGAPELHAWLEELGRLGEDFGELLELAIEDAARSAGQIRARIVEDDTSDWTSDPYRLTLDDGLELLRRPLYLMVENKRRDGAFLKAVGWRYSSALERLQKQYRLEISHGGGLDEICQMIRENKGAASRARTFVVCDSDALAPGRPSAVSTNLVDTCQAVGTACHRLRRRASENYLPPAAVVAWAKTLNGKAREPHLKRARAFGRLTPDQRYHYNMKRGHGGDARHPHRDIGAALFNGLDEPTMNALDTGFGNGIGDLFGQGVDPALLQKDDQRDEMSALFEALLERA